MGRYLLLIILFQDISPDCAFEQARNYLERLGAVFQSEPLRVFH